MGLEDTGTILVLTPLSGHGTPLLAPFSTRDATQSLAYIKSQEPLRTINGELIDLTPDQFKCYKSSITCTDQNVPAIDGAFRGRIVQVACVAELGFPTGGVPNRPAVSGSTRVNGDVTYFRPILLMMVMDIDYSLAEWRRDYSWQMQLEEIRVP